MADPLQIRPATEADLPALLALYRQLALGPEAELPLDQARRLLRRIGEYPDYHVYVAEVDGAVVWTLALLIMDNLAHRGAPSGVLEDMVVAEGQRGRGVGEALCRFAMARCRARGCYKLTLSSNERREGAHRFYERLGFQRHGFSFYVTP